MFSWSAFEQLSQSLSEVAATIYLPTHEAGPAVQQDPIRLKNLLRETQGKLQGMNVAQFKVNRISKGLKLLALRKC